MKIKITYLLLKITIVLFILIIINACAMREGSFYKENYKSKKCLVQVFCGSLLDADVKSYDQQGYRQENLAYFSRNEEYNIFWGSNSDNSDICVDEVLKALKEQNIEYNYLKIDKNNPSNVDSLRNKYISLGCDAAITIYIGSGLIIENSEERNSAFTTMKKQKEIYKTKLMIFVDDLKTSDKIWRLDKTFSGKSPINPLNEYFGKMKNWGVIWADSTNTGK